MSNKQLVTEKTVSKIETQVYNKMLYEFIYKVLEKKVKKRSEKITILEKELNETKEQIKLMMDKYAAMQKYITKSKINGNFIRVIKGGTGKQYKIFIYIN